MSLHDHNVLILGGSSGIGLATAAAALRDGARVTITGRDQARLDQAMETLGAGVTSARVDVADESATAALFDQHERIDHVFITAGTLIADPALDLETDSVRPAMDTRFWGAQLAARYAAPRMANSGSITFMSGTAGRRALPGAAVASASCGAVDALARALAIDLAPIRVNSIAPGYVDTPLLDELLGDNKADVLAAAAEQLPVKRIGRPDDIADAVLFLMNNGYVTGINLVVDGGGLLV